MLRYRYSHLRDNMVGSWCPSMGATGPLLIDRSGRGNHGTLTNMDPGTDWVASAGGNKSGTAIDCDGTNDYLDCGTNFGAPTELTVSAWVNFRAFKAYTAINCKQPSGGGFGWSFMVKSNGKLALYVTASSNRSYDGTGAFTATTNRWNHYAFTVNWPGTISGYFNGWYDGGGSTNGPLNVGTGPLTWGVDLGSAGRNADALFDSMAIWDRVLTPGELYTLARYRGIEHEVYRVPIVRGATVSGAFSLTADAGTFTLSGQNANTLANRVVTGEAGSLVLAGQDAGLLAGRKVTGEAASFALSGQDAGTRATRTTQGEAAAFTFTGQSAGFIAARKVVGEAGTFTLAGQDATLTYSPVGGFSLSAEAAAFSFAGQSANLRATRLLSGETAAFVLTGQAANLTQSAGGVEVDANAFAITDLTTTWAW